MEVGNGVASLAPIETEVRHGLVVLVSLLVDLCVLQVDLYVLPVDPYVLPVDLYMVV